MKWCSYMQKIYFKCKKCNSEMQEDTCIKCNSNNDVEMIIFNGTNKIPVRYIEEEKKIEPIIEVPVKKKNIWEKLTNVTSSHH